MDYMKIYKLAEDDFDGIIESAGGKRLSINDSPEKPPNADYIFDDAIIELKFVEKEGVERKERQQKLAGIFKQQFPGKPVVVLDPKLLDKQGKRNYYKAMLTPIKNHLTSANKQIKQTSQESEHEGKTKVVVLLNVGYGSLHHEEFKEIAFNRATNDTNHIDSLIVGGIYFYSDGFDFYTIHPFEEMPINISKRFIGFDRLRESWSSFSKDFMTSTILPNHYCPIIS